MLKTIEYLFLLALQHNLVKEYKSILFQEETFCLQKSRDIFYILTKIQYEIKTILSYLSSLRKKDKHLFRLSQRMKLTRH
ncbi:hypothetical protein CR513_48149, partial [Mucuna pruriens]